MHKKVSSLAVFHGHSNLGLSQANALTSAETGAEEVDCGLLGIARSAGNRLNLLFRSYGVPSDSYQYSFAGSPWRTRRAPSARDRISSSPGRRRMRNFPPTY